jgi:hypothetical protein
MGHETSRQGGRQLQSHAQQDAALQSNITADSTLGPSEVHLAFGFKAVSWGRGEIAVNCSFLSLAFKTLPPLFACLCHVLKSTVDLSRVP